VKAQPKIADVIFALDSDAFEVGQPLVMEGKALGVKDPSYYKRKE
jgi:hypothetical protein